MGLLPRLYWTDKILAKVFLPLVPKSVKPNFITITRFILTPVVVVLLWQQYYVTGTILFLITAFSDALDGSLARVRDQVTEWGKVYDPLADKLFICSVVYVLVRNYVDVYTAWLIITIEAIIIIAAVVKKYQGKPVQANVSGKIKMFLQVLGVVVLLSVIIFNLQFLLPVSQGTFYLAVVFGIISLITQSF